MTITAPPTKRCAMCGEDLPRSMFTADPRMRLGLKSYCKDCCHIDARRRYHANPEHAREVQRVASKRRYTTERGRTEHLKALYGITQEQYQALLRAQGYGCAACGTTEPGGKSNQWHVDHSHSSRKIRGLLCAGCNIGIGHLGDSPERLRAAAIYIETHQEAT